MTQKATSEQPNSQAGFKPPFKYSSSLSREQIAGLQATARKGHRQLCKVNERLVALGQELLERERDLGKDFQKWLAHCFPDERPQIRQAMAIAGLVNRQLQYKEQMMGWSRSALAALSKLDDERVAEVLTSGVKWTVKAIRELQRSLKAPPTEDPQAVATEEDWQRLGWEKYEVEESEKKSLQECARNLAFEEAGEGATEIEVRVGHIQAAVEIHKERLLPVLSHRRIGKSGAAPISMKDYNELMDILQRQRKLMRDLKEKNQKLIEEQSSLYQQALVQARQEMADFWERQKALLAHLRRADSERKQLAVEKQALEAEVAALKASAGTGLDGDAGAGKKVEADPQEVEEVAACFETVFGEQAVRKLHVSEVLSSLEKPVLETLQLLVEGLRRHAKFLTPFSRSTVSQKTPHAGTEFDEDFAFEVNQIPPEWEPL
ncbi:hypothetical protein [Kamptonema formosum]|uniref:hypothetical protein n=1 Tax=Kamptonema formosum TaxID=331992 RepID=UPI00036A2B11|nr:hypothetical protein [Oscillatoria sp. PCC 10802]